MTPDSSIYVVPASDIDHVWGSVVDGVSQSVVFVEECGGVDGVRESLKRGDCFLLLFTAAGGRAGVIFKFFQARNYKVAQVLMLFGVAVESLRDEFSVAEAWAKEQGCKYVEGWARSESRAKLFSRLGYRTEFWIVRKELK